MKIIRILNPFDHRQRRIERVRYVPGAPLSHYLDGDLVVAINGLVVPNWRDIVPPLDAEIVAVPIVEGDDTGKIILRVLAMTAVLVGAYYGGPALAEALGFPKEGLFATVASAVMGAGGAMLVNAILPAPKPQLTELEDTGGMSTQTYGWAGAHTTARPGLPIPVIYGKMKVGGNVIAHSIETKGNKQYLEMIIGLAGHRVEEIDDIKIDGNPVSSYTGVTVRKRYGTNNQSAIGFASHVEIDKQLNVKLKNGTWATQTTQGDEVTGVKVDLTFPAGLYELDIQSGNAKRLCCLVEIQYRKYGGAWQTYYPWPYVNTSGTIQDVHTTHIYSLNYEATRVTAIVLDKDVYMVKGQKYALEVDYFSMTMGWGTLHLDFVWTGSTGYTRTLDLSVVMGATGSPYIFAVGNTYRLWQKTNAVPICAATRSVLRKSFKVEGLEPGRYQVRMRTRQPVYEQPTNSAPYCNVCYWTRFAETYYSQSKQPFTYPNMALLGIRALATDQLSGATPNVTCVVNRGTFKSSDIGVVSMLVGKDSSNPAWAVYDILTNRHYGLGFSEDFLDKDAFQEWASFCANEGLEVNVVFDSLTNGWDAALQIAHIGRGMLKIEGSKISVVPDCPTQPTQLFSVGNIIKDSFREYFLPMEERANYIEVTYFDAKKDYNREQVAVYTPDWLEGKDVRTTATLYGVTSRKQAIEHARYMLNYNMYVTRTIEFEADIDAIACTVGDVIRVQHDVPMWGQGGRIVRVDDYGGGSYGIVLDRKVQLTRGTKYRILWRKQNDTIVDKQFTAWATQETDTITLNLDADEVPQAYDVWTFGEANFPYKEFRVIELTRSGDLRMRIRAIEYNESIYTNKPQITDIPDYEEEYELHGLTAFEQLVLAQDGTTTSRVVLTWSYSGSFVKAWNVFMREPDGEWELLGQTQVPSFSKTGGFERGLEYEFAVCYVDWFGNVQSVEVAPKISVVIQMEKAPPSDVEDFVATQQGDMVRLSWSHIPDVDLQGYVVREGATWETGRTVIDMVTKNVAYWTPPMDGTYRFWIKAVDTLGNESRNAAKAEITVSGISQLINVLWEQDDVTKDPPADGTKEDMVYVDAATPYLCNPAGLTDVDVPDWTDQTTEISSYAGDAPTNVAYETLAMDMGEMLEDVSVRLAVDEDFFLHSATDATFPTRTDQDFPYDTDQHITSLTTYALKVLLSDDGSEWQEVGYADVLTGSFRYLKARVEVSMDSGLAAARLYHFKTVVDVPDRDYTFEDQEVAPTGTTFTLSDLGVKFYKTYYVGVTALGPYYPQVTNKTLSGFTVTLFDSDGNQVAGSVDIHLRGY